MDNLKLLPPPQKKVVAKTLYRMGWSSLELEKWLGFSDNTIIRASEAPTPDELKTFEEDFRRVIEAEKQRGIALGLKRLLEIIPKERRIDQLVRGLEYFEGKNRPLVQIDQRSLVTNIEFFTDENQVASDTVPSGEGQSPVQDRMRGETVGQVDSGGVGDSPVGA